MNKKEDQYNTVFIVNSCVQDKMHKKLIETYRIG